MRKLTSYSQYFIHFFVIACGIIGVIGGIFSSLEFPLAANWGLIILMIIALFIYHLYHKENKRVGIIITVTEILLVVYLFVLRSFDMFNLGNQLEYIIKYDYYLNVTDLFNGSGITDSLFLYTFIVFIGLPFVYLIVSIVINKRIVIIKLIILLFAFIFPIIIKHPLSSIAGYAFTVFLIYSFVFSFLINKQSRQVIHQTIILTLTVVTLLFSHIFLETNPIFKSNSLDVLFNISSWIEENQWNQWFNTQNSTGASASINGALPNGNVTIDGRVALKVKSDIPFSSYLRSYSLGYYTNNRWQPVINEFEGIQNNSLLNMDINNDPDNSASVQIEMERQTKYQIIPYYPMFPDEMIDDSYYQKSDKPIQVNYSKNTAFMNIIKPEDAQFGDNEYYRYVLDEYMNVPDHLKPKFKQIVDKEILWHDRDITQAQIGEKTTFVNQFLNQFTNYDLNAGPLPAGKDFVDYFLFENQKGSCTHYASTATLLLRYLGVPSRYVTGFVMTTSDFNEKNEAIIRNNRAHAWVEIYIQGIGWVPYDFTKSSDYDFNDTTEASMANYLDEMLKRQTDRNIEPVIPEKKPPNPLELDPNKQDMPKEETDVVVNKASWYDNIVQYSQYFYVIGGVFVIFIIYRYSQKTYMILRIKKAANNKKVILMYQRMILIDKEKVYINQTVKELAYKAKFSQHFIDNHEVSVMEKELKLLQTKIFHLLPWYQKILYKYILGYM